MDCPAPAPPVEVDSEHPTVLATSLVESLQNLRPETVDKSSSRSALVSVTGSDSSSVVDRDRMDELLDVLPVEFRLETDLKEKAAAEEEDVDVRDDDEGTPDEPLPN